MWLLFTLLPIACAQHISVTFDGSSADVELVDKFVKRISSDNRFATTTLKVVHDGSGTIQFSCKQPTLVTSSHPSEGVTEELLVSYFALFVTQFYTSLSLNVHENDVAEKFSHIEEIIGFYSKGSLEEVIDHIGLKHKRIFVLYYRSDQFSGLEAVVKSIEGNKLVKSELALVDCKKHEKICEYYRVEEIGFRPQLICYTHEEEYQKLEKFQEDSVVDWMLRLKNPDIHVMTEEDVPYFRSGIVKGFSSTQETTTILFTTTKMTQVYSNFKIYAKNEHGRAHLGVVVNQEVAKWAHQPAFVTMKPLDRFVKATVLYENITYDRMVRYIEDSQRPSLHQICTAAQFNYALSTRRPLVVLVNPYQSVNTTAFEISASQSMLGERSTFYSIWQGLDMFQLYSLNILVGKVDTGYLTIIEKDSELCIRWLPIETEIVKLPEYAHDCDAFLRLKLPLRNLEMKEREEDVDDILSSMKDKVKHEEL